MLELTPSSPLLTPDRLIRACTSQRSAPRFSFLQGKPILRTSPPFLTRLRVDLSYPCLTLLIASHQHRCSGHETFTFEALYDRFAKEVAVSAGLKAAQGGMAMGLIKVGRGVMLTVRLPSLVI
jgi:hypothetical protein